MKVEKRASMDTHTGQDKGRKQKKQWKLQRHDITEETVRDALEFIDANCDRETWVRVLMAIKSELGDDGEDIACDWSERGDTFDPKDFDSAWRSITGEGPIQVGTLLWMARKGGWKGSTRSFGKGRDTSQYFVPLDARGNEMPSAPTDRQIEAADEANRYWNRSPLASPDHPYLKAKRIGPGILRESHGALLVPLYAVDGKLWSLCFVDADGGKSNLGGGRAKYGFCPFGRLDTSQPIYIAEGVATAATLHEQAGVFVVSAQSAGNLKPVAMEWRRQYPDLKIVIAGDNDRFTKGNPGKTAAIAAARAVGGEYVVPEFPEGIEGSDFNDLWLSTLTKGGADHG